MCETVKLRRCCHGSADEKPREEVCGRVGNEAETLPWGAYAATAVADDIPVTPVPLSAAALVLFL